MHDCDYGPQFFWKGSTLFGLGLRASKEDKDCADSSLLPIIGTTFVFK